MNLRICIASHLPDISRSVVALNIAASFALMEKRTLLLGMSPTPVCDPPQEMSGLVTGGPDFLIEDSASIYRTQLSFLDVLLLPAPCRETDLMEAWEVMAGRLPEVVVMNLPGWHKPAAERMLTLSTDVLIPIPCGNRDPGILLPVVERIGNLRKTSGLSGPRISGIVVTGCRRPGDGECCMNQPDMKHMTGQLPVVAIPDGVKMRRAGKEGLPVALVDVKSPGADAFLTLAENLLSRS